MPERSFSCYPGPRRKSNRKRRIGRSFGRKGYVSVRSIKEFGGKVVVLGEGMLRVGCLMGWSLKCSRGLECARLVGVSGLVR